MEVAETKFDNCLHEGNHMTTITDPVRAVLFSPSMVATAMVPGSQEFENKEIKVCLHPPWIDQEFRRRRKEVKWRRGLRDELSVQHRDPIDIVDLLKDCARHKDLSRGSKIHAYIMEHEYFKNNGHIATSLVSMYAKCGALAMSQQVLDQLPVRNVVSWNALIAGYVEQGQGEEALQCFDSMQAEGHSPNVITFTCALKACGITGAVAMGQQIHNKIVSTGLVQKDVALGSTLVDMYARCGVLEKAQQVFNDLSIHDVIAWTALIAGYAQQGQGAEALRCFDGMQCEGLSSDRVTFICALKACANVQAADKGKQIHDRIANSGMLEQDVKLGSALVDMYARCGALAKAQQVLDDLPVRNVVTWTALIAGYAQQGEGTEALKCFDIMQCEGHSPNAITFICALKACRSIRAANKGQQIHDKIVSLGTFDKDIVLGNTLMDMYIRCGAFIKAQTILNELPVHNVVTWTSVIAGYAQQGQISNAFHCFEKMQSGGIIPDAAAFLCILNSCSHSGLIDQAEMYFSEMIKKHAIIPHARHYCCTIDLFGRAGKFNKALRMIERIPFFDGIPVWLALLTASCKWGDVKIGRVAFKHVLHLEKSNARSYVSMANVYTTADIQENSEEIEIVRVANEAGNIPECWWADCYWDI